MKNKAINLMKFLYQRVFILFLLVIIAFSLTSDINGIYTSSMVKVLNRLRPSSYGIFINYSTKKKIENKKLIEDYIVYYKEIIKYIHNRPDAYGILGFCYYQLGKKKSAVASYKKAIKMNPNFFWFYYNLGAIYLKENDNIRAYEYFSKAVKTFPEQAYIFIESSEKIYHPIINAVYPNIERKKIILGQLKKFYIDTALILKSLESLSIDPDNQIISDKLKQVNLQIY